jgi:endogenous inhibitor of DNA gyrase (YacG/DUF329 family)
MGLFDSVMVPCPDCGFISEFQSKSSYERRCRVFALKDAPEDVLLDVNRYAPLKCDCGAFFYVNEKLTPAIWNDKGEWIPFCDKY